MKYSVEQLPESRVAIDVELDPEQVEKALNRAARRISQRARIPGFRPGKAPRYIVEARFGRAALYEEVGDDLIRQALQEILDQETFDPIAEAQLDNLSFEPFAFRLIFPVRPTVTLGDYRALRFPAQVREVTDEDVRAALERMQEEQTIWKAPDPLRPARLGDRLVVDLAGRTEEKEFERKKNVEIELGDEGLLPGFSGGLVGTEVEQTVEVAVTIPEEAEDKAIAGQAATYTVTILAIKEAEVPPLDDDFARTFGQEDTLEEMSRRIQGQLEEIEEKAARQQVLDQMLTALIAGAEVDMPEVMVEWESEAMFKEQEAVMRSQQLSMEQLLGYLGKSEEEYRQELRGGARERVVRSLVLQELIRTEELVVEEEDIEAEIERLLEGGPDPERAAEEQEKLRQELSEEGRRQLRSGILSRKLEEFMLAIAQGNLAEMAEEEPSAGSEVGALAEEVTPAAEQVDAPTREVEEVAPVTEPTNALGVEGEEGGEITEQDAASEVESTVSLTEAVEAVGHDGNYETE